MSEHDHSLAGLRSIRKHRGILIREAANALGINESSYIRFENGSRQIHLDKAITLAKMLRCSVDDLCVWRPWEKLAPILGPAGRDDERQPVSPAPEAAEAPPPPPAEPEQVIAPPPPPQAGDIDADELAAWDQ